MYKIFLKFSTESDYLDIGHLQLWQAVNMMNLREIIMFHSDFSGFLGGLSLHLNHLIAWRVGISFWQFGTLPIGIFLSNLDSRHLMISPRSLLGQF